MNKAKSATGKSVGGENVQPTSSVSKDAQGQINVRMMQNVLLVWLDVSIDENSDDCKNTITQLRHSVNHINTFTDRDQCIDFLTDIYSEKVIMIISGGFCQQIVPLIHDIAQIHNIFVTEHEQWTKEWYKIKGIFTEISPICEALKQAARQCETNDISISLMSTTGDLSKKNLDQLDCSFMYTQILKEILLTIKFEQEHINQFTDYCQDKFTNDHELHTVSKFKREYHDQTPVWWYTSPYFLYTMINRALRLMDVEIIMKMGFFISDLHRDIAQLHSLQLDGPHSGNIFLLYRGQGLSETDFNQLKNIKGGLIAFNNFLSTSKDRDVSLMFAESNSNTPDMVGILFVMKIDPSQSTTPFTSINEVGYYGDKEDEVLFSIQSVFRIRDIKPMFEDKRLYQVDLTLTNDNDQDLQVLAERIREEIPESGWFGLGSVLFKMGHFDKAEEVYQVLLARTTDESDKGRIYHQLASIKDARAEYQEAIKFYEKALEISEKTIPQHHPSLSTLYNNIGVVYKNMGDFSKALSNYKKDLEIQQQSLPSNDLSLSVSYNNIALVYDSMGDYSEALSYYEKSIEIKQQSLPSNHPTFGGCYNNIGIVYCNMGDYSKALSNFEKGLEIKQKSLPTNHPSLSDSYNNIGMVYYNKGDYSKALSNYEKALEIRQQSLPPNHPDLGGSYNNIGEIYRNLGDFSKALSNYEKGLEIKQQSLPPNHPSLSSSYNNMGLVYENMDDYSNALSNYEKALEIKKQSLPPNHPDFGDSYNNIGIVYDSMGDYSRALSNYEKALAIQQQSLPPNHRNLGGSYNNIGTVYYNMGDYSKALYNHEKGLEIKKQSLPPNHPSLNASYYNIDLVRKKMGD